MNMKTITLKLMLAFLLISNVMLGQNSWNYMTTSLGGTINILFGMSFPPGQNNIGYACAMYGTYNGDGTILKTTDGGENWVTIYPLSGSIDGLQSIWFINDTVGFAAGWNNYFIKTTDGGTNWTNVTCGSNVWYYTDVEFWDDLNGVACAYMNSSDQCVFITADGGDTWVPATSGVIGNMMGICYADQNTLYAVNTGGAPFKSTDGGHNWTNLQNLGALLFGVDFADANFGVVGGEEKIFATNDGGATWTTYTTGYENFYPCKAFTDGTAYCGGTDENIYVTTDYGNTWQFEHNGSGTSSLYRIKFTDNGTAFACGSQGTIIKREPSLTADFEADATDICEGTVVTYTDLTIGTPLTWSWSFEGGTPPTSTQPNPTVTYYTAGVYDVELEVNDGSLSSTELKTDYIAVDAIPGQANTPSGPVETCGANEYEYTTNSVSYASTYLWEVSPSDAGTIAGAGTVGTFTADDDWTGSYTVKVRAENACGDGAWSTDLACDLYLNPEPYFLTGGGGYCEGDPGRELTLDGSEAGVDYELFLDNVSTGNIVAGTGSPISFGYVTDEGIYTCDGYTAYCSADMMGEAYVYMTELPGQAGIPTGPEDACNNASSQYSTSGSTFADTIIWILSPGEAGELAPMGNDVTVNWSSSYTGMAYLSCEGENDCGTGLPSDELEINVNASPTPEISGLTLVCNDEETDYQTADNTGNTYAWLVTGGDIIAGSGTYQITVKWGYPGTGYVNVTETNAEGCDQLTEDYEVTIDDCTGIEEFASQSYRIYPNPTRDYTIVKSEQKIKEIEVYDLTGKVVISIIPTNSYEVLIDMTNLQPGIFMIRIKGEESEEIHKLLLQ